jgi:hypothetical protein
MTKIGGSGKEVEALGVITVQNEQGSFYIRSSIRGECSDIARNAQLTCEKADTRNGAHVYSVTLERGCLMWRCREVEHEDQWMSLLMPLCSPRSV